MRTRVGRKVLLHNWNLFGTLNQRKDLGGQQWKEETVVIGKEAWRPL